LDVGDEDYKISEVFPKEFFKKEHDYLSLLDQIKLLEDKPHLMQESLDSEENGMKKSGVDKIFAIFLIKVGKHLKPQYLKEIALFISIYRKSLIEIAVREHKEKNLELNIDNLNAEFIIERSNEFILEFLPKLLEEFKIENCLLVGAGPQKINNAILLTQHFGNWLFSCHFTDSKLEINYGDLEKKGN